MSHVAPIGLCEFIDEVVRGALAFHWEDEPWEEPFDRVLHKLGGMGIDAIDVHGCSHQVMWLAEYE